MGFSIWPGLYVPDWNYFTGGATLYGVLMGATSLLTEKSSPMAYSKFGSIAGVSQLPSKLGMFVIYVPSVIVAILNRNASDEARFQIVNAVTFVHFMKRVLEVAFVHIYSGSTDVKTSLTIAASYATSAALNLAVVRRLPSSAFTRNFYVAGMACFIIGELLNGYHHILLRRLRTKTSKETSKINESQEKGEKKKQYFLPRGGLFDYCVTPHYATEQLSFLGIILLSQNTASLMVNSFPFVYLTIRSNSTYEWYKTRLSDDEKAELKNRKRLLPGIW
ncbi:3-oxo-5-alpha-steroid 4-dehydrogenase-domain-containing protein [Zychaea mexicana]|uniref:3-oxo-5-alpha-steroid 4-dehydrogenase-domain-containing protein n=1 Tax=Zychaea mexicana TaxID=64656 RepID=UPI0022FDC68F|nr:3-oxo-5-alpha-steroid 4-dehydrogenase-domain-containing protein [Zychaea mexicana]KAI9479497.1 3-oxo-5-alpha-steroid 4-dehydrogenase-domain-containing protein [Zychaea mexicana]